MLSGVHPKVVQEILGHGNINVTLGTYSHTMPSMKRAAADSIGDFVAASKPKPAETEKPAAIDSDSGSEKAAEVILANDETGQPEN